MDKNALSITKLAKLRKLTSETLRYYDRIGLVKPNYVDTKTNYRYYSIRQYEKLGTIRELRQLGMSIDDIIAYFTDRNFEKSVEMLKRHETRLEREIEEKTRLKRILNDKIRFLNGLASLPDTNAAFTKEFMERYMITFDEPAGGPHEHAYAITKLEGYLDETAPILASDRVGVFADESILQECEHYIPSSPFIFGEKNRIPAKWLKIVPAGLYLCMYYKGGALEKYHESFEIIKKTMRDKNLTLNGDILQLYVIDVTLTSDPNETLMEIQVPVRKI